MALKVVVAGLGARGREWVREVKAAPAYELVGCSDIDPNALQDAGAALNIPAQSCFPDLREAIERTNCAAVIVATPADRHTEA
ncbi:MAG: Gfo/Idh/MocA family oxidoreductase, partial [bacterium]